MHSSNAKNTDVLNCEKLETGQNDNLKVLYFQSRKFQCDNTKVLALMIIEIHISNNIRISMNNKYM